MKWIDPRTGHESTLSEAFDRRFWVWYLADLSEFDTWLISGTFRTAPVLALIYRVAEWEGLFSSFANLSKSETPLCSSHFLSFCFVRYLYFLLGLYGTSGIRTFALHLGKRRTASLIEQWSTSGLKGPWTLLSSPFVLLLFFVSFFFKRLRISRLMDRQRRVRSYPGIKTIQFGNQGS